MNPQKEAPRTAMTSPESVSQSTLWTIGHSTRSLAEFIALLRNHDIACLVDVRRHPGSRRYPHFNVEPLAEELARSEIRYIPMPLLGGRRSARPDSLNGGWRNASFRGYADYMDTPEFEQAFEELLSKSRTQSTAMMCAEALPWRCHRTLIADALVARGHVVRHILTYMRADLHQLTPFARVAAGYVTYPPDEPPPLF